VVPVTQAHIFYQALQRRNVPVECVIYPREGHGVSEYDHLRDAIARQLRWLATYVK
jgi:dipeptidyl aminopeptidase/acylaminoacyl peptidase